ncbi:MAG TPA: hypothetical protein VFC78_21190 [Tepidisphaeraceae bacterium]|nr:hypothetical protein [Tepidisphaeraceae bacterium]
MSRNQKTAIVKIAPLDEVGQAVFDWIVAGHTQTDIAEAVKAKWPATEARPAIITALQKLAEAGTPDRALARGWCIEAAKLLYRKATDSGDHGAAVKAVKLVDELARTANAGQRC